VTPAARWPPALAAVAVVLWLRLIPLGLPSAADPSLLTFTGADGREHVYLGDHDGYLFVRHAEHLLRTGTACDAWVDGECRDARAPAPVGRRSRYHDSLHVWAIAGLHRLVTAFAPDFPITSTAFFVPVLGGVLVAVVAYAAALRLAGPLAGLAAALAAGTNPLFLFRSAGADTDVWNVLLPLCLVWAVGGALAASDLRRSALWMVAAAVFVGLHARTWRGWVLTYGVALGAVALWAAVLWLRARRTGDAAARAGFVRAAVGLGVFWVAAGLAVWLAGGEESYLAVPLALLRQVVPAAPTAVADPTSLWPDTFETVSELADADLRGIAGVLGGAPYLLAGWVGMLCCLLPARAWGRREVVVLGVGLAAYGGLMLAPGASERAVLIALPLAAGVVWAALGERARDGLARATGEAKAAPVGRRARPDAAAGEPAAGGALVAALWFAVTFGLAFQGQRFVMLLAPAFALVFGVALGRAHALVVNVTTRRLPATARFAGPVAFVVLTLALVPPLRTAHAAVVRYRPRMNDAWWDTLTALRTEAPADAVVAVWWDFGHWATFLTERRVLADGASLGTRVPHWMARALLAIDQREAVGLLRMLACGSDAAGEPEEARGATAKLRAAGLSAYDAHELLIALAPLARAAAAERLRARGLDAAVVDDVLASTHCAPPPIYLVLSDAMRGLAGWRLLGAWDMRRAYAAKVARDLPEREAVADLRGRFGLSADDARGLWREARRLEPSKQLDFIAPSLGYLTPEWVSCAAPAGVWECPVRVDAGQGRTLEAVRVVPQAPAQSRFVLRRPRGDLENATPGLLVLAGSESIADLVFQPAAFPALGVLADLPHQRVLLGRPAFLESVFTQLLFLDGRYGSAFTKVSERRGYDGERVVTWRVNE